MRNLFQYTSLIFSFVVVLSRTFCQWMCLIVLSLFSPPGLFGSPVPGSTFTLELSLCPSLQGPHTGLTGFYLSHPYSSVRSLKPPLVLPFHALVLCTPQLCLWITVSVALFHVLHLNKTAPRAGSMQLATEPINTSIVLPCVTFLGWLFKKSFKESMDRMLIGSFCP